MRFGSRSFWLGIAVGFAGALVLLIILSIALIALEPGGSQGITNIDYEPITLEHANSLIDSGQVHRIAIRPERNVDKFWLDFYEGPETPGPRSEPSRRWKVTGLDVFVFTESIPNGVPILSDDEDEVGLTPGQFDALIGRIKQYNATAASPIEMLDQRGGSDSLSVPR